jgi:transcriptional regulator with XRE-family HTH domain
MPTIGDRIKEVREGLGWTQEKLAEKATLSKGFLSDVENNKRDISSTNVLKIANAMGASLEYLLRGKSEHQEDKAPVEIPPELSRAAVELGLTYSETLTLLETHRSVIARRSNRSLRTPTVEEWKQLRDLINKVYPADGAETKK